MSVKSKIKSYSKVLEDEFGKIGTPKREKHEAEALDFYASQILLHNRKESKITQKELAKKSGVDKTYISRIETGAIQPTFSTFMKLINAMGKQVEIV
ncbi:MAG: helix-turn-helix transcriptional regulator [Tenacibaculum sp.]|nr:helix-turn-helix transcriptional regulator [Tenacibaculum sp.]